MTDVLSAQVKKCKKTKDYFICMAIMPGLIFSSDRINNPL
jgi:hypothetical protein